MPPPIKRPRYSPSVIPVLSDSEGSTPQSQSGSSVKITKKQKSWVWRYFKTQQVSGKVKYVCQVAQPTRSNHICGAQMTPDQSQSTKSLARHLDRHHNIQPSTDPQQGAIKSFLESGTMKQVDIYLPLFIINLSHPFFLHHILPFFSCRSCLEIHSSINLSNLLSTANCLLLLSITKNSKISSRSVIQKSLLSSLDPIAYWKGLEPSFESVVAYS